MSALGLARLIRSVMRTWSPDEQVALIVMVLMGPCGHPCTCVIDQFREQIDQSNDPTELKEEARRILDVLEQAMKLVQAAFQQYDDSLVSTLVADAERHANGEPS